MAGKRFVSNGAGFAIALRAEVPAVFNAAGGIVEPAKPMLEAKFDETPAGPNDYEAKVALEHFGDRMTGFTVEEDEMTRTNPRNRLGLFDSAVSQQIHNWSDKDREFVEDALMNARSYGGDFILVEEPKLPAPWPKYDDQGPVARKTLAQTIADKVHQDGYEIDDVIAYEKQNRDRGDVIEALEGLRASQSQPREAEPEVTVNA